MGGEHRLCIHPAWSWPERMSEEDEKQNVFSRFKEVGKGECSAGALLVPFGHCFTGFRRVCLAVISLRVPASASKDWMKLMRGGTADKTN